jgi:hypothetical protein
MSKIKINQKYKMIKEKRSKYKYKMWVKINKVLYLIMVNTLEIKKLIMINYLN